MNLLSILVVSTAGGPRLTWTPVKELEKLRAESHRLDVETLEPGDANLLAGISGELLEVRAEFEPAVDSTVTFKVCGVAVAYNAAEQELMVDGLKASAPLREGKQRLIIYATARPSRSSPATDSPTCPSRSFPRRKTARSNSRTRAAPRNSGRWKSTNSNPSG